MIRLFFSAHPGATTAVKTLTLPVSGILIYGMLETVIFTASADERALTDFRELFFFLLAGVVLAWSYELEPPKKQDKAGRSASRSFESSLALFNSPWYYV